jgi:UDPglucose 6-dehydrogenase
MALPKIAYVGMTHLGICSAIGAASKGFSVLCFDQDQQLVQRLFQGKFPVDEPELDSLFSKNKQLLEFSSDPAALRQCDLIYVAPDVATDDFGNSDLTKLDGLANLALDHATPETTVVVLSQVSPGFTRSKARTGRALFYQVETLIFGRAIERVLLPERFIIGCEDPSGELPPAFKCFLDAFGCPVLKMRYESAEFAKISINCCLVASITVANTLAELCENIGADWSEIAPSLKLDKRIGEHSYLSPGLGIAGGNLERDLATVLKLSSEYGSEASVIRSFIKNSGHRRDWVLRELHQSVLNQRSGVNIGVLGLTYKENTNSIKNSASIELINHLDSCSIRVFDPVLPASVVAKANVIGVPSPLDAANDSDAFVIMTPWSVFKDIDLDQLSKRMRGRLVLDPFRVLDSRDAKMHGLDWRSLGAR